MASFFRGIMLILLLALGAPGAALAQACVAGSSWVPGAVGGWPLAQVTGHRRAGVGQERGRRRGRQESHVTPFKNRQVEHRQDCWPGCTAGCRPDPERVPPQGLTEG